MHGSRLISPPTVEPVSIDLVRKHLRLDEDFTDDDDLIGFYIAAARSYAEKYTNRPFLPQTWEFTMDHFPWPFIGKGWPAIAHNEANYLSAWVDGIAIRLNKPSLLKLLSITFYDLADTEQLIDLSKVQFDRRSQPPRIVPLAGTTWPLQNFYRPGSVRIRFTAGSYAEYLEEQLTVSSESPCMITPSNAASFLSLDSLSTIGQNPVPVPPVGEIENGVITVGDSLAGQNLQCGYFYSQVPKHVMMAVLFLVGHWYQNREASIDVMLKNIPFGVNAMLDPEVFTRFGY